MAPACSGSPKHEVIQGIDHSVVAEACKVGDHSVKLNSHDGSYNNSHTGDDDSYHRGGHSHHKKSMKAVVAISAGMLVLGICTCIYIYIYNYIHTVPKMKMTKHKRY